MRGWTGSARPADKVRRPRRADMAGFLRGWTQTPSTVGTRAPAAHPLQATVCIAFRRTPDQRWPGVWIIRSPGGGR